MTHLFFHASAAASAMITRSRDSLEGGVGGSVGGYQRALLLITTGEQPQHAPSWSWMIVRRMSYTCILRRKDEGERV